MEAIEKEFGIEEGVTPTLGDCRQYFKKYGDCTKDAKQIQDKVRGV